MNVIERLSLLLESIPVEKKPLITTKDVQVIEENILEATEVKTVQWDRLSDNHLKYELCVHFGWIDLQENYGG